MKFKTLIGLLIVLIMWSCAQQNTKSGQQISKSPDQLNKLKSGLLIENGINRGTDYTDSLGIPYSLRNIPITIINDTTLSIEIEISFSKEYNYPQNISEKFKLIPLPEEWAADHSEVTEHMLNLVPKYIGEPLIEEIIEPGEKFVLSIGSVYPRPAKVRGVLPRTLFVLNEIRNFSECEWLIEKNRSTNNLIPLGLKTVIGEKCLIIPCGSISYLKKLN